MNRLLKESLKKTVEFEELRRIQQGAVNFLSTDADLAFQAAVSLFQTVKSW
jgi:hypothetical protein